MTIPQITDQNSRPVGRSLKVGETCHYRTEDGRYILVEKVLDGAWENGADMFRSIEPGMGTMRIYVANPGSSPDLRIYCDKD
jgi:hypothetical protein